MKSVPKINTDGLYLEDVLVDDAFSGVAPLYADPPEPDPELLPATDTEAGNEQSVEEPQLEIAGYIVGVPVPAGLYLPRFDLETWHTYQDDVDAAQEAYQTAYAEWSALPVDERGEPPIYTPPEMPELWSEGLTQEEIDNIKNITPAKTPEQQKIEELENRLQTTQDALDFILMQQMLKGGML